ncbi:hypothetical protein [Microbacterium paraoxydans]|uniref:hypothetical protein n=1 Tax=Microbacterium paraoxydans TaxID=199592 RepID=UPI003D71BE91
MTTRQLRLLRAAAVSASATLIAAVSHTIGGGAAPHPLLILAVTVLFLAPTAVLLGLRRSRWRVAVAVLAAQAAFHLLFQLLGSPTADADLDGTISPHVHHFDLSQLGGDISVRPLDAAMLLAHLGAAVLTTLLVWHAERIVRAVAGWFRALLRRASPTATSGHRRPSPLRPLLSPPLDRAMAAAVSRRGPPVCARG